MPPTDLPQKRVLVVDDSKFVRTTFATILKASFEVREESDGESAWEAVETDPSIVMVFTDLDMPRLNGFGLLSRIRGSDDARVRALPVVVISGYVSPEVAYELETQINRRIRVLRKPFDPADLRASVGALLAA